MDIFDERILKLKNLKILDTEEEKVFDEIVEAATYFCNAPIGFVNLVDIDRQWFKAKKGIDFRETPLDVAICTYTIGMKDRFMVVPDFTQDERFKQNPFVTGPPFVRSYLGICLTTEEGYNVGTLAIFDTLPRDFTEKEILGMKALALGTMHLINEKSSKIELQHQNETLKTLIRNLESFNYTIAHDVKAPLKNIATLSKYLLENESKEKLGAREVQSLEYIKKNSQKLTSLVDNLLAFSKSIQIDNTDFRYIDTFSAIQEIIKQLTPPGSTISYEVANELPKIFFPEIVFERIFQNLISNAIRYVDLEKAQARVEVGYHVDGGFHTFWVEDNGRGMSPERLERVFSLFNKDLGNEDSSGVGLCIVKELLQRVGGSISISSQEDKGTKVIIKLPIT